MAIFKSFNSGVCAYRRIANTTTLVYVCVRMLVNAVIESKSEACIKKNEKCENG